jgi:hypothetical protein
MNYRFCTASARRMAALGWSALALFGLALSVAAQAQQAEPAKDLVAFKGLQTTVGDPGTSLMIPLDPPILADAGGLFKGESELFGPYTANQHITTYLGVDGNPLFLIGEAVWTGANGDALSFSPIVVLVLPSTKPGVISLQGATTIRSGRGRFLGATGSATVHGERDLKTGVATLMIEGLVTRPKP